MSPLIAYLDGAPCGLLNHLTASCDIVTTRPHGENLDFVLEKLGVMSHTRMTIVGERSEEETGLRGESPLNAFERAEAGQPPLPSSRLLIVTN